MKKLQNNFTTPEQSKRLLELGVPADSADMYYCRMKHEDFELPKVIWESYSKSSATHPYVFIYLPCWSVGRLMEIFDKCFDEGLKHDRWETHKALYKSQSYIDYIMYVFEHNCACGNMDFSKLEE